MRKRVTKAIFPVAGLGTRFLPATKSVPKEIMTLVDRPLVQYAIDEARAAGIKEFIFITSRGKSALEDYFDNAPQLEAELRRKGKEDLLEILKSTNMDSGEIAYMRQHKPLGLGHAVWCARRFIANEPFAVILPDDVIAADKDPALSNGLRFDHINRPALLVMGLGATDELSIDKDFAVVNFDHIARDTKHPLDERRVIVGVGRRREEGQFAALRPVLTINDESPVWQALGHVQTKAPPRHSHVPHDRDAGDRRQRPSDLMGLPAGH